MKELIFDNYDDFYDFMDTAFRTHSNIVFEIIGEYGKMSFTRQFISVDELQGALLVADIFYDYRLTVDGVEIILDFTL